MPGSARVDHERGVSYCRLCGAHYQPAAVGEPEETRLRAVWSVRHSASHSQAEHRAYRASGLWCLPEAVQGLAAIGVINVSDIVFDQSGASRQAALEA